METTSGKETISVLRRLIPYSEKIFQLFKDIVTQVSDPREKPRISAAAVVKSSLLLFWARLGSINAWEQFGRVRFWQRWLEERTLQCGHPRTSPDTRDAGDGEGIRNAAFLQDEGSGGTEKR